MTRVTILAAVVLSLAGLAVGQDFYNPGKTFHVVGESVGSCLAHRASKEL